MEQNKTLNQTLVTVPEFARVRDLPLVLTDYAMHNGAAIQYREKLNSGLTAATTGQTETNYGECWLSSAQNGGLGADTCRWVFPNSRRFERAPETKGIGIIVCLENAAAGQWGKTMLPDGTTALTKENKLSIYPRTQVTGTLQSTLLNARENNELTVVGAFHRPRYCNPIMDDQTLPTIKCDVDICYTYRGQCYVNCKDLLTKRDDWYRCEPVRVLADTADDRIQLQEIIIDAPYDEKYHFASNVNAGKTTVADTALSNFLNHELIVDLALSTYLSQECKLTHTQDVFQAGLKSQTAAQTAQLVR